MLMHVDSSAVVWVISETVMNLFSEIIAELGNCLDPVEDVSPGVMVVASISGRKVKGREVLSSLLMLTVVRCFHHLGRI